MKCPLTVYVGDFGECYEEKCAWYDSKIEKCSILTIVSCIDNIDDTLSAIKEKM